MRKKYLKPQILVIDADIESILVQSGDLENPGGILDPGYDEK